jgi:murein DD-endopeptidase MepM/ murein hydrolase activator NlpD
MISAVYLRRSEKPSFFRSPRRGVAVLCALGLVCVGCWLLRGRAPQTDSPSAGTPVVPPQGVLLTFPTPQMRLSETTNPAVFMPTESGRVESALYGSVRTRKFGRSFLPAFHEGVDFAPTARDAKGRAADPVFAVAEGRVGYINRIAGNSSYGIYVVLLHGEAPGEFYTLYSHLASAADGLKFGDPVVRGTVVGKMGNSSTLGIPVQRSHLHFEFGVILNRRFDEWFRREKLKPFHGAMHGYNLAGLNPVGLFPYMNADSSFVFAEHLMAVPAAFRILVPVRAKPDYYRRYPFLWSGGEPAGALVMDVSESGVPLQARSATAEEVALSQKNKPRVLEVFVDALGRNGTRLVVREGSAWVPGRNADQWLDILLYP